jgi:hypothetical protein
MAIKTTRNSKKGIHFAIEQTRSKLLFFAPSVLFVARRISLGIAVSLLCATAGILPAAPVELGERRELFVDDFLIERLDNVWLQLAQPRREEVVLKFDRPWEYASGFVTVIKDGGLYRMYYRGGRKGADGLYDNDGEVTCYAESRDGINWTKPPLGLHASHGRTDTNIVIGWGPHRVSHNFAPIRDDRPGVPAAQRYKAVGGKGPTGSPSPGLFRYVSADGIHWKPFPGEPIFAGYALDSLNVLAWLPAEQCYAVYLRTWSEGGTPAQPKFKGIRTISRSTSKDFVTWTEPEPMRFGDTPLEHLYTNNTQPYFRAPHLLVALPFRYLPGRQAYTVEELTGWGVPERHAKGTSDAVLLTSRGGNRYDRTFMESFLRPGGDRLAWHARETQPSNGIVPTGEREMSFYVINHYPMPTEHLTRVSLRTDGFASVHSGYEAGTLLTKLLTFAGDRLLLNFATSAAGSVRVEVLDADGRVLTTGREMIGDDVERAIEWERGAALSSLAGQPIRLRFTLKDADVYALRFAR